MKIVRFSKQKKVAYGVINGDLVTEISGDIYNHYHLTDTNYPLKDLKLLAPCLPTKIVAVGLNYRFHAEEVRMKIPEEPLLFLKPSSAVIGPNDRIVYPSMSHRVDYEAELGVVIGKEARSVSVSQAKEYILGYSCFNDVTARDLQAKDKQFTRSKSFDTFAPIGPCIETELDPAHLKVQSYLNGELKQSGDSADLIFSVFHLVSFISMVMTLLPGDFIATGTPEGIGPMQVGDTIEIVVEGIGNLRNQVADSL
jgi:2-keto-4-pentenoate hydratase/2-oxohepta-3-ene-1,7-dioic acid hydratase in catechol pathway